MNILDRVIAWASPARGLRRVRARLQIDAARKYESASTGRRFDGWLTQSTSANTEINQSLVYLRNRHRALVRDNPWAARAVQAIVSNVVGYGFTQKVFGPKRTGQLFKAWWGSKACDADGRHNGAGLEALILRTVAESGECLIRRYPRPASFGPVPLQIRVLEPDYLDHGKTDALTNGGRILQGVEFDREGRRVAYWLFADHPGDLLTVSATSVRVDASDVAHVFRGDRPGRFAACPGALRAF